jgi:polyisoprenoid-binding protein YceI
MRNTVVFLAAALLALGASAEQKLLPAQSEIVFVSKQMGVPVDGRFKRFDAQLAFDPKKPAESKIAFSVDLASVSTGAAETETELAKPGWFDSKKFAQATFESTAIKGLGGGKFEVAGKLGIKGVARDVIVPVTIAQAGAATTASGAFVIKRLAYRIGDGEWSDASLVADEVQVRFKLALTGVGPM